MARFSAGWKAPTSRRAPPETGPGPRAGRRRSGRELSLIHISEPTRRS
ncbi:hypothetical protein [Pseudomonas aeruginosa]|nr:hypothetical protein [Pseudomonas aeruginosa]MBW6120288.1 hypothetical protein [Pseudomonas aeruginosa]